MMSHEHHGVSNRRHRDCLLYRLLCLTIREPSTLRITGPIWGKSTLDGGSFFKVSMTYTSNNLMHILIHQLGTMAHVILQQCVFTNRVINRGIIYTIYIYITPLTLRFNIQAGVWRRYVDYVYITQLYKCLHSSVKIYIYIQVCGCRPIILVMPLLCFCQSSQQSVSTFSK